MEEFHLSRLSFCNKGRELNSLTQTSEYFFSSIYLSHETTLKNIPRLHVLVFIYFFILELEIVMNWNYLSSKSEQSLEDLMNQMKQL